MNKVFSLVLIAGAIFSSTSFAQNVVKTCKAELSIPGEKAIPTLISIIQKDSGYIAITKQIIDGVTEETEEQSGIDTYTVRAGLSPDSQNMNLAELFISSADMMVSKVGPILNFEFDLKSIRYAKLYQVGEVTEVGGTVIIEATDENGKDLGTFVGGFIPFVCE